MSSFFCFYHWLFEACLSIQSLSIFICIFLNCGVDVQITKLTFYWWLKEKDGIWKPTRNRKRRVKCSLCFFFHPLIKHPGLSPHSSPSNKSWHYFTTAVASQNVTTKPLNILKRCLLWKHGYFVWHLVFISLLHFFLSLSPLSQKCIIYIKHTFGIQREKKKALLFHFVIKGIVLRGTKLSYFSLFSILKYFLIISTNYYISALVSFYFDIFENNIKFLSFSLCLRTAPGWEWKRMSTDIKDIFQKVLLYINIFLNSI